MNTLHCTSSFSPPITISLHVAVHGQLAVRAQAMAAIDPDVQVAMHQLLDLGRIYENGRFGRERGTVYMCRYIYIYMYDYIIYVYILLYIYIYGLFICGLWVILQWKIMMLPWKIHHLFLLHE